MKIKDQFILTIVNVVLFGAVKCSKNCRTIDLKDRHFRSVVFAEAHGSGLGSQLFVYALMSQLRAEFNFDTYVSRECRAVLSNVFTVTRCLQIVSAIVLKNFDILPSGLNFKGLSINDVTKILRPDNLL